MAKKNPPLEVGCASHFLDSGSFTLWTKAAEYAEANPKKGKWGYYDTEDFFTYMCDYAAFIKRYARGIDLYANVDVIPNPELSWRNQQYLEKEYGLHPVPVVHYRTNLKWLRHYMEGGYGIIALGGLVGSTAQDGCVGWIDRCFDMVCDGPDRLPRAKIHGFGVTSYPLLLRYPWYSVDSSSWTKVGAYGGILVPHKRSGAFCFTEAPYVIKVAYDSPDVRQAGKHFNTLTRPERLIVREWLKQIGIPFGKLGDNGEVLRHGVMTRHTERKAANLLFFEAMRASLPDYPWPFRSNRPKGFGLL